jgi:hypothetical protein
VKLALGTVYMAYTAIILIAASSYLMADVPSGDEKDEYRYFLTFEENGRISHYTVQLADDNISATVELKYTKSSNTLLVDIRNVESITVHTHSLFTDEGMDVFGVEPESDMEFYKQYFIDRNLFNVNVEAPLGVGEVLIEDIPKPDQVLIEGVFAEDSDVEYDYAESGVKTMGIPPGTTHVDIYYDYGEYDLDRDGLLNDVDDDDDDDGYRDLLEKEVGTDPLDPDDMPGDLDGDGIPDAVDDDRDGDGVRNDEDSHPSDPTKGEKEEVDTSSVEATSNAILIVGIVALAIIAALFWFGRKKGPGTQGAGVQAEGADDKLGTPVEKAVGTDEPQMEEMGDERPEGAAEEKATSKKSPEKKKIKVKKRK